MFEKMVWDEEESVKSYLPTAMQQPHPRGRRRRFGGHFRLVYGGPSRARLHPSRRCGRTTRRSVSELGLSVVGSGVQY